MYPWAVQACRYPIKEFQICRFDDLYFPPIPLNDLFRLQKCDVIPPNNLYHPVRPVQDEASGKLLFPLTPITGTWMHVAWILK